jgi:HD-like signal output (HDOD) protein
MTSLLFPRETLLHVVKSLPAAPQILARLGQMRLDPVADLNDVTALLRCDASLTARIIRIANTAAYATGEPYASLEQALARIGFGEIYRIAGFAAVSQMSGYSLREYGISGAQLRENSLLVALLMERLAALAGADAQEAYSAGLLRSIGKMAVQGFLNGAKGKGAFDPAAGQTLEDWERGLSGFTNSEAAAFVLGEWRFPANISTAIALQYTPDSAAPECRLAHLLNLAAGGAETLGFGLRGEQPYWTVSPEKLAAAGIDAEQLATAAQAALEQFNGLRAAVA